MQAHGIQKIVFLLVIIIYNLFYKENELDKQISSWLDYAKLDIKYIQGIKAIIGPYSIFFHI